MEALLSTSKNMSLMRIIWTATCGVATIGLGLTQAWGYIDCRALMKTREPFALTWAVQTTTARGTTTQIGQRQVYRQGDGETIDIYLNPSSRARSRWGFIVGTHIARDGKDVRGVIRYEGLDHDPFAGDGPFMLSETSSPLFAGAVEKRIAAIPHGEGEIVIGACSFHVLHYELLRYESKDSRFQLKTTVRIDYAPDLQSTIAASIKDADRVTVMSASEIVTEFDHVRDIGD